MAWHRSCLNVDCVDVLYVPNAPASFLSVKSALQLGIFFIALIVIIKLAITHHHHSNPIKTIAEFRKFISEIEKQPPWRSIAAKHLPIKGSLFCWVMTTPHNHATKAIAINDTWIHECDHGQLFSSAPLQESIPATAVFRNFSDERELLYWKTIYAFQYSWSQISKKFDWYLKADDDAYVFVDNMKHYLAKLNPNEAHYLGFQFRPYLKHGYNSGGVYVLSRAAVKLFVEKAYLNETICPFSEFEDVGIAQCLSALGIYPHDTRDSAGRQRFSAYNFEEMFHGLKDILPEYVPSNMSSGYASVSPELVTLHHALPSELRVVHLVHHHVRKYRVKP
uniref:N-acetylgalactosaminide beta-1,3-galactosyltransferase n=1 Tax=Panagrellus redivivus TaxID=6233 RepID=A0A7E4W2N4_PANRE